MTKQELFDLTITDIDKDLFLKAKNQWDHISKPLDGMGDFEEIICRIAAIQKNVHPDISNRTLLVYCSDNGIVGRGVSQSEQDITFKVAQTLAAGTSSACCLAKRVNTSVLPIDIGINSDMRIPGVRDCKVASGTQDFLMEPAMTEEEVLRAIETGIRMVCEQKNKGTGLIATGEMGIGNTTTSAAVLSALLNIDSESTVGRGAGLDDNGLEKKKTVVREGIARYREIFDNAADEKNRGFEILRYLGGLDIAAMCGTFIGGALYGIPIVIDGVISAVSALLAQIMVPGTKEYMIASHSGKEKGTGIVLGELGLKPFIGGNMSLGEGTGALMMISLLDNALFFYINGSRFEDAGIEDYERFC